MTLFNDREFVAKALMDIVRDEGERIVASNLATKEQLHSLLMPAIKKAMKYGNQKDVIINALSDLHEKLSAVKLSGDFEKCAIDPFYDFSGLPDLTPKSDEERLQYKLPEPNDSDEEDKEEDEKDEDPHEDIVLEGSVSTMLKKLAKMLADQNNHQAAYLVERAIRNINTGDNK